MINKEGFYFTIKLLDKKAINFISTALNMRTDGMLLHKMPLKIKNKQ